MRIRSLPVLVLLQLAAGSSLVAQTPVLVKDISPAGLSSSPAYFATLNGKTYFSANDGVNGTELWATDGTAAGTAMVKDIYPGGSILGPNSSSPSYLEVLNGKLYFAATTGGILFTSLWVSDGTTAGTVRLPIVFLTLFPSYLTRIGSRIYFAGNDARTGIELWATDGTVAGTVLVADINPGTPVSTPQYFAPLPNGKFVFAALTTAGRELCISDGTTAGTAMLKDINTTTATASSSPSYCTAWNGKVYFAATDGVNGNELWVTDGTAAGTVMLKDIYAGSGSSSPYGFDGTKTKLYFRASDGTTGSELWETDGTAALTKQTIDLLPGAGSSSASYFRTAGSRYTYFQANDGTNGTELWRTDGTLPGTQMLADIWPGSGSSGPYAISQGLRYGLHEAGPVLYFAATDPTYGTELWKLDTRAHAVCWDVEPGCGTPTRVPTLRGDDPVIGKVGSYDFDSLYVGSVGVLVLGVPAATPLPLPAGCFSHVDLLQPVFLVHTWLAQQPTFSVKLPVPNKPGLKGVSFALQGWSLLTNSVPAIDLTNGTFCVIGY